MTTFTNIEDALNGAIAKAKHTGRIHQVAFDHYDDVFVIINDHDDPADYEQVMYTVYEDGSYNDEWREEDG